MCAAYIISLVRLSKIKKTYKNICVQVSRLEETTLSSSFPSPINFPGRHFKKIIKPNVRETEVGPIEIIYIYISMNSSKREPEWIWGEIF